MHRNIGNMIEITIYKLRIEKITTTVAKIASQIDTMDNRTYANGTTFVSCT